jgi:hypothetical protein
MNHVNGLGMIHKHMGFHFTIVNKKLQCVPNLMDHNVA